MKQRIVWIDNLKGLLLLLTCTSHFIPRPLIVSAILKPTPTYYVPLFVFLSGYLSKIDLNESANWGGQKILMKKKFKRLLIPYFFFSFLGLVSGFATGENMGEMIWRIFYYGTSCHAATPIWFAAMLFMVSVTFSWIIWSKRLSKLPVLLVIIACLSLFWYFTIDHQVKLPWYIHSLPFYGPFFLLGYATKLIEKGYWRNWQEKTGVLPMLFVILALGIGLYGLVYPIKGTILSIICPISLMIGIIRCMNLFSTIRDMANRPIPFFQFVAFNGIAILGIHVFLSGFYQSLLNHFGRETSLWLAFLTKFILVWGLLFYVIIPFANRYFYKVIGKETRE